MSAVTLITGAAGFIGSHLSRALLADGRDVVGIDNFDAFYGRDIKVANVNRTLALADGRFELVEMDVRDPGLGSLVADRGITSIYHLAALAGVRPSIEEPQRYVSVNVDGLSNVLEAARTGGCRRMVFASSSSVYGNNDKVPFAEDDPVDEPISPYAATKRAGELLCGTYGHLFDMRIAAARLFTVYGPSQRPDLAIARFMKMIDAGDPVPMFGDGTSSRDYTFIDDVVDGLRRCEGWTEQHRDSRFRVYNIGGSNPVELSSLIEMIGAVVGRSPIVDRRPMQPGDVNRTYADLSRSTAELGYAPTTPLEDGLQQQHRAMHLNQRA